GPAAGADLTDASTPRRVVKACSTASEPHDPAARAASAALHPQMVLRVGTRWSSGSASDVAGTESDAPRCVSVYPWLSGIGPPTALPREDDVNHRGEAGAAQSISCWGGGAR